MIFFFGTNRCFIPECDDPKNPVYDQPWVQNVIPGKKDTTGLYVTKHCDKFKEMPVNFSKIARDKCYDRNSYNHTETVRCKDWVYDEFERTIVQDVNEIFQWMKKKSI